MQPYITNTDITVCCGDLSLIAINREQDVSQVHGEFKGKLLDKKKLNKIQVLQWINQSFWNFGTLTSNLTLQSLNEIYVEQGGLYYPLLLLK